MPYQLRYRIPQTHGASLVATAKVSPDGSTIATCSTDNTVKLWSLTTQSHITTLRGHTAGISDLDFSPNGQYLATASDDLTVRLWDLSQWKTTAATPTTTRILQNHTYHTTALKFDARSRILVTAAADENIRVWDCSRSRSMRTLSAHSDPVSAIDLSFDDTIIVSASHDGLIRLFDTVTGGCLKTLIYDKQASSFPISNVIFSPNSKFVLSSSLDGSLRLWDYMNDKVVKSYRGINNSPVAQKYSLGSKFINYKNTCLICSGDENGNILFWDIQSQEIKFSLKASQSNSPIMNIQSISNGNTLISISLDGELCVWDITDL